jgi:hypothetical protein
MASREFLAASREAEWDEGDLGVIHTSTRANMKEK